MTDITIEKAIEIMIWVAQEYRDRADESQEEFNEKDAKETEAVLQFLKNSVVPVLDLTENDLL